MVYNFLGEEKDFKIEAIFSLIGNVLGYDITLFNYFGEEELLLEPKEKLKLNMYYQKLMKLLIFVLK